MTSSSMLDLGSQRIAAWSEAAEFDFGRTVTAFIVPLLPAGIAGSADRRSPHRRSASSPAGVMPLLLIAARSASSPAESSAALLSVLHVAGWAPLPPHAAPARRAGGGQAPPLLIAALCIVAGRRSARFDVDLSADTCARRAELCSAAGWIGVGAEPRRCGARQALPDAGPPNPMNPSPSDVSARPNMRYQ